MDKKKEFFIIDYTLYPFQVMISLHKDYKSLKKTLKTRLPESSWDGIKEFEDFNFDARTAMFKDGATCICFKDYCLNESNLGIIAHECIHAVNFLFARTGITFTPYNDEHFAYAVQFLIDSIIKEYATIK